MKLDFRQRLLATTLLVGAGLIAQPAFAQDTQTADPAAAPPSGPVEAQPTPSVAATGEPVSETKDIVVTGTRIPSANLESAAPVTVVSSQDLKLSGTTRVEDLLNSLPSVGASQSSGLSNGATGTAEVDLRYLGSKRTLALINGRRLVPGDPNSSTQAADLNFIPSSVVKRVEVLTGGASSVYGADAVAGVVNFIMDTNFTGIRFDGQYSVYQHSNGDPSVGNCAAVQARLCSSVGQGLNVSDILNLRGFGFPKGSVVDGGTFDGTVSIGSGFDDNKGHALAYFGYRKVRPVLQGRRDFSSCVLQNAAGNRTPGPRNPRCGGSATANPGTAVIFATSSSGSVTSTVAALGPGTITPFSSNLFNFAPLNYFLRPDERYIGGVFADYEINNAIKPYLEFMFMDDHTLAQIAPSGDFGNTLTINCDNPLLSASQRTTICSPVNLINGFVGNFPLTSGAKNPGAPIDFVNTVPGGAPFNKAFFQLLRRNTEGGPRINDLRHTSFRGVLGTKGDLSKAWSYDAYYQYGRTNYDQVYKNEFSAARLTRALDVVDNPNVANTAANPFQPVCRSFLDGSDPTCVPFDVFTGTPVSPAAVNFLNVFGVIQGNTSEQVANANFTGALGEYGLQSPWAEEGFGVNVGVEYRKESLSLNPDQSFQTGDLTGQGAPTLPVSGNFRVFEYFGEAQLPIVQNNFIDNLSLGLGYRKSYYKLSSGRKYNTNTYKLSAEFAPIRDIRFRAAYNRAVRAPNIQELFAPQFVGLDGSNDPCSGHIIQPTEFGCIAQGVKAGTGTPSNPAGQYNGLLGGDPNLSPEKATTKTAGVILQPRFLPRFAFTVDYFNINVKKAIQGFGADAILQACIDGTTSLTSVSPACALVNRDAAGSIWLTPGGFVRDLPNNEGEVETSGLDFNGSYSHGVGGLGSLSLSFLGTYLRHYKVDNGLTEPYDCAGLYGPICSGNAVASGAPLPKWRHKARATLQMRNGIGVSLGWRMVGKVKAETLEDSNSLAGQFNFDPGLHIKAQHYFDLATTFTVGDHYNLRLGVNNILDNDPPLVTGGNANRSGSNLCPAGACNGNTYPGTWDALGRYIYAGVTLDF
ncbi:MAG: TonB-dependent receptor [Sphingomonas sp.]|uniref:TonB-dependent receptor domain-containing protein n=1 Tax=Sphingomonas sp. TaxID=28214 RepID=UPI00183E5524|nr:TonB-dependent receptor [Sphingomonas sp.]MBA3666963.1 TonB-dependent receptor [Sphingomonas sp.]